ncbi:hypothetical protein BWQ96_09126 [Gracilariopsis chorda]|uniref:Uncharacterized protein n=1 Tax=Gracilariopsis chorda TaxID=448386 RepID=A0A2V3IGG1_9FLOR|nr:hypothetical protein BWQ96_09126 [Gracilariopsis chorda]|eukprot:PXF41159.1 hypothetical protein BWQ96_09126 [Gracilariopsis chorda]
MKTCILDQIKNGTPVQKSRVHTKAQALLEAQGESDTSTKANRVVDTVVYQGVAEEEKLSELNPDIISMISDENTAIFIRPNALDDAIVNLPLKGFKRLQINKEKIIKCLKETKGKQCGTIIRGGNVSQKDCMNSKERSWAFPSVSKAITQAMGTAIGALIPRTSTAKKGRYPHLL